MVPLSINPDAGLNPLVRHNMNVVLPDLRNASFILQGLAALVTQKLRGYKLIN